jgi:hypothetical protein
LHIFLSTGRTPQEVARQLAAALGAEMVERDGSVYVSLRRDDAEVGGEVMTNMYGAPADPEPDEISALDGYDTTYEVRRVPYDEAANRAAARQLFDEIVERLSWPVLLVDGLDVLVAAWHPDLGHTDFPAGTTPDSADQELWSRHAITGPTSWGGR